MLFNLFTTDNIALELLSILIAFPALLFSLSAHEWAHGFAAYKQGDGFAKASGRLTLNPFKHLDPLGTLLMLLVGFGWAKPVPVVPSNFKNGRKSMIIVSIAGVLTNLILAVISIFLLYFIQYIIFRDFAWLTSEAGSMAATVVFQVLMYLVIININLAVFNLVPIPPLDGSRVIYAIAPDGIRELMKKLEGPAGIFLVYILIFFFGGVFYGVMSGAMNGVLNFFYWIVGA